MQSASKVRAQPKIQVYPPADLLDKVTRYCEASGSSLSKFGLVAIENAIAEVGDLDNPKLLRRRKPARSA